MKPFRLTPNNIEINCFDKRIEDQKTTRFRNGRSLI
jgi:hypothetical protein